MGNVALAEMPKYQCHKKVWALKIKDVVFDPSDAMLTHGQLIFEPEVNGQQYGAREMPREYFEKHKPEAGGYYVQYEGGYESFSPGKAFEDGYTLIN